MEVVIEQRVVDGSCSTVWKRDLSLLLRNCHRDHWLIRGKSFCPIPKWQSQFCSSFLVLRPRRGRKSVRDRFGDILEFLLLSVSTERACGKIKVLTSKRTRYGRCHVPKRTWLCGQYPSFGSLLTMVPSSSSTSTLRPSTPSHAVLNS